MNGRDRQAEASLAPPCDRLTPADRYEELFVAVQSGGVFDDSKTFVDCAPLHEPETILARYRDARRRAGFDLAAFVHAHFRIPSAHRSEYESVPGQALGAHIDGLWPVLTRHPVEHPRGGSALQLPHAYVVPGGRFRELYYWDSYFTMLGLAESGQHALLHAMTDNFAYLIETFGHVPNGTRTYYLSRSQPPVFAWMAELCEAHGGRPAGAYLAQMRQEHAYWMADEQRLARGEASRRVVRLPDGSLLNRYWDDRDTPREESWLEDVATAEGADRPANEVYRDLRAAAESGWDFSTRWLRAPDPAVPESLSLSQIDTTSILPVDLNAFLHKLERTIARLSQEAGDAAAGKEFEQRAQARRDAMDRTLWNGIEGAYFDHDWRRGQQRRCLTAATVAPLFARACSSRQARAVAATVQQRLLAPGGFATTECRSGQQWDRPNGWAPLQWMAVEGLSAFGHNELAQEIRRRWLRTVCTLYRREGKLVEKYRLREVPSEHTAGGGGGEYPLQDGFGWTNGVTRMWAGQRADGRWGDVERCGQ
ncbi:alpha,alpha-trehalase [Variovorax sp. TBS-050B]|uniref:alpha,alpha-trehalase TreF n=1 Tax=Variovorax sp. TBS-050B TaxID=2940551 RepID=UPI002474996E|nr:alpha,alpha-trehalase TreF [Variovorax sp. TBS-050B]MDH6590458.1 alpha,alpha-trehalase [Variovorax sp. TBS-050B]